MPRHTTITCPLTGATTEPANLTGSNDLPPGWVSLRISRVVPNPAYANFLTTLHAQLLEAKAMPAETTVEELGQTLQDNPSAFPGVALPPEFILEAVEESISPEAAEEVFKLLAGLGWDAVADLVEEEDED